jgi:hypothetical protein
MAGQEQSIQLAQLWVKLHETKREIDNVILPVASHLSIEDPQLMIALEELSERIDSHFNRFRLQAAAIKGGH